ncbi:MAG: HesB/YadR/YfhF-family protein [Solirubrobacteraceae bacterium]
MLTITTDATEAIGQILADPEVPGGAGIRIAAAGPAMNGDGPATGTLQIVVADEPAISDEVIEDEGARIFVDDSLSAFLADKLLDVSLDGEQVQFTLGDRE